MSTNAIAYLRVSGKSQVEGDGFPRQQAAVQGAAERLGFTLIKEFREEGVSGTTHWGDRPAFAEMVAGLLDDPSVKTIIVENLSRIAREYVIQDAILLFLASKGIDLISADTDENITEAVRSDPMKKALIQMQAVFSEFEKNSLVRKLRAARQRKKEQTGRCEGAKPYGLYEGEQGILRLMTDLRSEGRTVRTIAALLNESGHPTRNGRPWSYAVVAKILARQPEADPEFE